MEDRKTNAGENRKPRSVTFQEIQNLCTLEYLQVLASKCYDFFKAGGETNNRSFALEMASRCNREVRYKKPDGTIEIIKQYTKNLEKMRGYLFDPKATKFKRAKQARYPKDKAADIVFKAAQGEWKPRRTPSFQAMKTIAESIFPFTN